MLSQADNAFLTQSGRGTPMGELLRRFWMPALLSKELPERDGPPKKIKIMGEDLLAFRASDGRVGIVEPHCPHRGANLYYGRNEECGLRCAFHGWKFDVEGNCVDLPTSPPESNYRNTIKLLAYPTREWADMIWVYMGPRERMPELPQLEMGLVPASQRYVSKKWQDCNWVQSLEGGIDTAHFSFLHAVLIGWALGCAAGMRSRQAAQALEAAGFAHVVDQRAGWDGARDPFGQVVEKGWLVRDTAGHAHRYRSAVSREATLNALVGRLVATTFGGSAEGLVMALLHGRGVSKLEADRIRTMIDQAEGRNP